MNNMKRSEHLLHHHRVKGAVLLVLLIFAGFLFVKTIGEIKAYRFIGGGVPVTNTITIEGMGNYVLKDRGSAIKGERLDVLTSSHAEALRLGVLYRRVKVLDP